MINKSVLFLNLVHGILKYYQTFDNEYIWQPNKQTKKNKEPTKFSFVNNKICINKWERTIVPNYTKTKQTEFYL